MWNVAFYTLSFCKINAIGLDSITLSSIRCPQKTLVSVTTLGFQQPYVFFYYLCYWRWLNALDQHCITAAPGLVWIWYFSLDNPGRCPPAKPLKKRFYGNNLYSNLIRYCVPLSAIDLEFFGIPTSSSLSRRTMYLLKWRDFVRARTYVARRDEPWEVKHN